MLAENVVSWIGKVISLRIYIYMYRRLATGSVAGIRCVDMAFGKGVKCQRLHTGVLAAREAGRCGAGLLASGSGDVIERYPAGP